MIREEKPAENEGILKASNELLSELGPAPSTF